MAENKKTVLLAEDENDLLEMYTMALSNSGLEVLQSGDGLETLKLLEKEYARIDLILLDIVMPAMDGFETLKKIKEDKRFQKIKVVIFTNLDNDEDKKQAFDMGVDGFLIKAQNTPSELAGKISLIFSEEEAIP